MTGWKITEPGGSSHTMGTFTINAGKFAILSRASSIAGVTVDYCYGTGSYPVYENSGDTVQLLDSSNTVQDSVNYSQAGFPSGATAGKSMQLRSFGVDNNLATSWCHAATAWPGSTGDMGTPNQRNKC